MPNSFPAPLFLKLLLRRDLQEPCSKPAPAAGERFPGFNHLVTIYIRVPAYVVFVIQLQAVGYFGYVNHDTVRHLRHQRLRFDQQTHFSVDVDDLLDMCSLKATIGKRRS